MDSQIYGLVELTASALYAADALDHNKRDEAPWAPWSDIADQSKVKYRKTAQRLVDLNLVIIPLGRLQALEQAVIAATKPPKQGKPAAKKVEVANVGD